MLFVFFVSVGALPYVPIGYEISAIALVLSMLALVAIELVNARLFVRLSWRSFAVICLIGYLCVVNYFVADDNDIDFPAFLRALAPFLFVGFYLVIGHSGALGARDPGKYYIWLLVVSSVIWASLIFVGNVGSIRSMFSGDLARLTFEVPNLLIPLGLVGFVFTIYGYTAFRIPPMVLSLLFLFLIIGSGYRSQLLLAVMALAFRFRNVTSVRSIVRVGAVVTGGVVFALLNAEVVQLTLDRFSFSSGDLARAAELGYAIRHFAEAPIFGNGLGFPVPILETRPPEALVRFDVDAVPYIHNFIGYTLMDTGAVGALLFLLVMFQPIVKAWKVVFGRYSRECESAWVALVVIFAYFMISASFRQIQMVVVVMVLVRIIELEYSKRARSQ